MIMKIGKIHEDFITKIYFQGKKAWITKILDHRNFWSYTVEKTKILIFNKLTCSSQFVVYNTPLEQVKEYKYLSIMLSDKSLFKATPKVLAKQANKALFSLMKKY